MELAVAHGKRYADASWSPAPPQRPRAWRAAEAAEEQDVAASLGHRTARSLVAATNPRPELLMGQQLLQQKLQQSLPHWAPPAERELLAEAPANVSHALAELVAVLGAPPLVQAVHCDHPPECSQLDMMQQLDAALPPCATRLQQHRHQDCRPAPSPPQSAGSDVSSVGRVAVDLLGGPPDADLPAGPGGGSSLDSVASDLSDGGGWFQRCRGCSQLTASEEQVGDECVPLCRGCCKTLAGRRSGTDRERTASKIMHNHRLMLSSRQ